jgi:hypothetical protein
VATSTIPRLVDYVLHTPPDAGSTLACTAQRTDLIERNLAYAQQTGLRIGCETDWRSVV